MAPPGFCHALTPGLTAADIVAQARDEGLRTIGWPCNDESALVTLLAWRVDAITTDERILPGQATVALRLLMLVS